MNIKAVLFLLSMCFLPLIIFIGYYFTIYVTDKRTNKEIYLDLRIEKEYAFKIMKIYRDNRGHNALTLEGNNKKNRTTVPPEWENGIFKIGDSIQKKAQTLKILHYRDNKLIQVLDYNDIYIRED